MRWAFERSRRETRGLDNDGRDDIVYGSGPFGIEWKARLALPIGNFGDPVATPWRTQVPEGEEIVNVADWDGDGLRDLISVAFPLVRPKLSVSGRGRVPAPSRSWPTTRHSPLPRARESTGSSPETQMESSIC